MPGFLCLLVWAGLLNDDFGVVNRLFGIHVPWLFGGNLSGAVHSWPRIAVILVSVWLTTPYFFLVSTGLPCSRSRRSSPRPHASTAAAPGQSSAASRCRCSSSPSRR